MKRMPWGSSCRHMPCRRLSRKSSRRRNFTPLSARQSLQYTAISISLDWVGTQIYLILNYISHNIKGRNVKLILNLAMIFHIKKVFSQKKKKSKNYFKDRLIELTRELWCFDRRNNISRKLSKNSVKLGRSW